MTNPSEAMPDQSEAPIVRCHCGERAFVALLNEARQVWCSRDLCWRGPLRATEAEAVAAWNDRAPDPEAAEIIRLCEEALEDYVNDCTNEECEFCIKARTALAQIKGQNP